MYLIPQLIAFALLLGFGLGGSLRGFEHLRIHRWGLALIAAGLQYLPAFAIGSIPASVIGPVMMALSYAALGGFLLSNRWIPGARVMCLGLFLNLLVVMVNGGMPVQTQAIVRAGGDAQALTDSTTWKHHAMTEDDMLWQLGDVIPIPSPVRAVLSIGDVLLYGGLIYAIVQVMRGQRRENPRPMAFWFPVYRGKHAPEYWRMPVRYRSPDPAGAGRSGTEP